MFCHHLMALHKKLFSSVTLLKRLVSSGWSVVAKTLRTIALSLVYSTTEYCTPVCCCSANTRFIDSVLNDTLRIVTGCMSPTQTDHLPTVLGIQPLELRRLEATFYLACRGSLDPDHIFYGRLSKLSDARQEKRRSRCPFVPSARNLLNNLAGLGIRSSKCTNHK